MPAPTFSQKLVIPGPPPGALDRPRLSRQLDAATRSPLTVVHGPPGCGKTTAVAAWARSAEPTPSWITLDAADRDPRHLATTLHAGLDRDLGAASPPVPARPATPEEAEDLLVSALTAIAESRRPMTTVLDCVAELRDSAASGLLLSLLSYVPDNLRLVVIAGSRVPLSMGRLRLAGRLVEVDGADLALRPEETAALVRGTGTTEIAPGLADEVHHLVEGDIAFAAAAAAAVRAGTFAEPAWRADSVGPHIEAMRPDERGLVLDVAPIAIVTPDLAVAVSGRRDAAELLASMARETAVVVAVDGPRPSYRLHHLVRRALLDRVEADEPGRIVDAHRAAARWRQQHGQIEAAIEEWIAAGDEAEAWALIADHHVTTFFAGGREAIAGWVERLPAPRAAVDGAEAADRAALMLMVGRPDEASRWTEHAAEAAETAGRAADVVPLLSYLRAQVRFLWGDLEGALELHQARPRAHDGARPDVTLLAAAAEVEALAQLGRFDEARQAFLDTAPWAPFAGEMVRVLVPGVHASLLSCEGRLTESLALAADGLTQARDLVGFEGSGTSWSHLAVGTALLEQGEVHAAVPSLLTASATATRAGLAHIGVRAAAALSRARWLQGRPAEAFATVEAARRSPHVHPLPALLSSWLDQAEARLHLLGGDPVEALAVLGDGPGAGQPPAVVLRAWAALDTGDRALAQDLLGEDLGPTASLGCRIEADLLRVRCRRDPVLVRRHIARAVHRGAVDGYLTVFLDHRDGVVDALHEQRATEPSPYVTDLLLHLDTGDAPRLAEALTDRELSVLSSLQSARSIEAIARDLHVSVNTLKTHVKAVYRKLDATTRADAVRRALALRLIGPAAHDEGPVSPTAGAP